ncbi:MAG: acylphosphatase [Alphaproteobacteria bacterium]
MADRVAVQARIEGRVQGVWFRGWTVDQATARDLAGWVRNRRDGTVEALFAGPEPDVRDMLAVCHKGPPAARVTSVTESPAPHPDAPGFVQLPTV